MTSPSTCTGRSTFSCGGWPRTTAARRSTCSAAGWRRRSSGALLWDLNWPDHPFTWLWFGVSLVLGVTLSFGIRYLVGLAAFWLLDVRGLTVVLMFVQLFCSGMVLPLVVFPDGLEQVVRVLPFAGLVQVPADVLLEKATGPGLLLALGSQLAWAAALLGVGRLLTRRAARRLVVQGG